MKKKFIIILFLLAQINIFAEIKIKEVSNYKHITKEKTDAGIFYKICLEGLVYWMYTSKNPEAQINSNIGGITPYYNSKTLQLQRCKILEKKCIKNQANLGNRTEVLCYKKFKEIK